MKQTRRWNKVALVDPTLDPQETYRIESNTEFKQSLANAPILEPFFTIRNMTLTSEASKGC